MSINTDVTEGTRLLSVVKRPSYLETHWPRLAKLV